MKKVLVGLVTGLFWVGMVGVAGADMIVSQGLGNSAYTASNSWSVNTPDLAFDGDFNNGWNAGDYPTQWIEVNLGKLTDITGISLSVGQSPNPASTTHEVWTSSSSIVENTSGANLTYTFSDSTYHGQLLSASFSTPLIAQYVQIRTISSPSWVSWREIQVMSAAPVPEPATMVLLGFGLVGLAGISRKKLRK